MRTFRSVWTAALLAACFALPAAAQTHSALIDADRDAATGCSVASPAGTVDGIEWRVSAFVAGLPPQVSSVELSRCEGGGFVAVADTPGGYPVGLDIGPGGSDVVEFAQLLGQMSGLQDPVTLHFLSETAGGADLVAGLALGIPGAGEPPAVPTPRVIPTLHWLGLSLVVFAVLLMARRHRALRGVAAVFLLLGAGLVWAANFLADGQIGDWSTESPLATDATDDSSSGEAGIEIVSVWAATEGGRAFFRIDVANAENEPPVATPLAANALEDQAVVLSLSGSDTEGDALTFAVVAGPGNGTLGPIVSTGPSTAEVTYTPAADFNGSDAFDFTVNDGVNDSAPAVVALTVTAVNDAPGFTAQDANLFENGGAQTATVAAAISAGPADESAQALSFEIVGNSNPALFSVAPSIAADGTLSLTPAPDTSGSATLSVQLRDDGGTANGGVDVSAPQDIVVTVQGVNKIPSFTSGGDVAVLEDAAPFNQPWATALDDGDGGGQTLSFVITGNTNAALFASGPTIDGVSGNLSFTLVPDANGSATVTVFLQDDGGTANGGIDSSAPVDFTISVGPVNDAPGFALTAPPASAEDAGPQLAQIATALSVGPPNESGQTLTGFTLVQTGIDATLAFSVPPSVSASGELSYTAAPNAYGSASFDLSLSDDGGTADGGADTSPVQSFAIAVQPVNDAPAFTAADPPATDEDAGAVTVPGWVTGFDPGPNEVGQGVFEYVVTVSANPALFSVAPVVSAAGELSYTAAPDAFGVATISVAVRDDGGTALGGVDLSPAQSFDITVNPINDVPVLDLNGPAAGIDFAAAFVEAGGPVAIVDSAALSLTDVDSAQIQSASITLTNLLDAGQETLALNVGASGLVANFDGMTGVLNLTGAAAPGVYQNVLRTVTYQNGSTSPDETTRVLSFVATDAEGAPGAVATSLVSVQAINTIPSFTAGGDVTVDEDSGAYDVVWASGMNDNDGGIQTLLFVVDSISDPSLFSVAPSIDATSGNLQFSTAPDANGTATVQVRLTDSGSNNNSSAPVSFEITLTAVDDDPTAVADAATVAEDSAASAIDVLANDTDPDGGAISITSVTQPANGTVVITGGGTGLTYQPAANYCNTPPGTTPDTFTYTLAPGGSSTTVTVSVTCADDNPVAVADAATVSEDSGANAINVLANDTDIDGGPISISAVTQPANGTVVITGGGSGLAYQPAANYCNTPPGTTLDTFTYTLTPGGSSTTVTVSVTCVDDNPVAVADAATVAEDSGASAIDVLANDTDIDGGPISITAVTQPANGTVVITGGGTGVTYQPAANYCNTPPGTALDTFTYTLTPGGSSTTVTVSVTCVDDNPVAVADAATVGEDSGANAIDVLANDTDPDGGAISITSVTQPTNGIVVITGGGTGLTYQPNANYCNTPPGTTLDTFTYTLAPGGSSTTVTVGVTCVDDTPVAVADAATVSEDSGANAIDVLANDTDLDGGPISVSAVTQPANGTVVITGGGTGVTYQPAANYCNTPPGTTLDTFTYTLTPGGSSTTVTVGVTCVDDNPTAVADAAVVVEDSGANALDVLANDTDPDGGAISIASVTQPANGTVAITGGGTGLTYQPNANYCNTPPGTTPDSFTYTLTPGGSSTTVTVGVTCVDDPPVAVADAATVLEDDPATAVSVLANDTDIDAGPISIAAVTQPANGAVVITGGGTGLTYQPNANYCNDPPGTTPDTFSYTLTPGGSSTTVSMTVTCVNDLPVFTTNPVTYATAGNTQLHVAGATLPGLASIVDADGLMTKSAPSDIDGPAALTVVPGTVASTNGGSATTFANGSFTYVPPAGFSGTDSFTYAVSDGMDSVNGTVNITVSEVVWYVRDIVDANNPAAGDTGTSANAFETLADAQTASGDNHIIFVFRGNTGTTPLGGGITLKNGQKLHGEGIGLTHPTHGLLVAAGTRPHITNAGAGGNGVTVLANTAGGNRTGVEIRGLQISGNANAIDVTSADAALLGIRISENTISAAGAEGIDINIGSSNAAQTLAIHANSLLSTGNALDVVRTNGTLSITNFANNSVDGNTGGSGLVVTGPNVVFDATPGGNFDTVSGGALAVGISGNGVGASGLRLNNVTGDLSFDSVNVFADAGTGIEVSSTGAFALNAGLRLRNLAPNTGTVQAVGGPAVSLNNLTADLRLGTLTNSGSPTTGVNLVNLLDGTGTTAQFAAGAGSSITTATGTAFNVDGGNGTIVYAGTLTNTAGRSLAVQNRTADSTTFSGAITDSGQGVLLNANNVAHTTAITGGLTLNTTTNAALTATNGGTLSVQGSTNTITTTTATAVNLSGTTIDGPGVSFRSIGSTTASANTAIILSNTGAGPFSVTGTGTAGSGGTISNKSVDAVQLNTTGGLVTLNRMIIEDIGSMAGAIDTRSGHDAIQGLNVNGGLSLTGTTIRRISDQAIHGGTQAVGTDTPTVWNGLTLSGVTFENSNRYHVAGTGDANNEGMVRILGIRGTVNISNSTFSLGAQHLDLEVTAGTLNLTATGNSFDRSYKEFTSGARASIGNHCIDVRVLAGATANVTVGDRASALLGNDFLNCRLGSIRVVNQPGAGTSTDAIVANNDFRVNDHSSGIGGDFDFPMGGVLAWNLSSGTVDTIVENNLFELVTNASGGVGQLSLIAEAGPLQALVQNNTFDRPGNAPWWVQSRNSAASVLTAQFVGNTVIRGAFPCTTDPACGGGYVAPGLRALADAQTGATLNFTMQNNVMAQHDTGFDPGQTVEVRALNTGAAPTVCADFQNNQSPHGYSLEQLLGTVRTVGTGSCAAGSPSATCQSVLQARGNQGSGGVATAVPPFVNVFGTVSVSGTACPTPSGAPF